MSPVLSFIFCCLVLNSCNSSTSRDQLDRPDKHLELSTSDNLPIPKDHDTLGREFAKKQLYNLLDGKAQPFTFDTLIKSSSTAIKVVEPMLFDFYGKEQIRSERPYEVYLIDGYWHIGGTIPKGSKGGGFEIILSAKDAKVIRFTHYK